MLTNDYLLALRTPQEKIDLELATFEHLLSSFRARSSTQVATLQRSRNDFSPISLLPVEILTTVLEQYLSLEPDHGDLDSDSDSGSSSDSRSDSSSDSDTDSEGSDQAERGYGWSSRIATISLVSRRWNDVVNNSPRLWSKILTRDPPWYIHKALKQSRAHPIDIEGHLTPDEVDVDGQAATLAACGHVSRWSSAKLSGNSATDFDVLTYPPAPILRNLELDCCPPLSSPLNLFNGTAPLLETLTLEGFPLCWSSPILSRLQSLKLGDVCGPTAAQFLNILRACPDLHNLHLTNFTFSQHSTPASEQVATVELAKLKTLRIYQCPNEVLRLVLAHTSCPSADWIRFNLLRDSILGSTSQVLEAVQPIVQFTLKFLRQVEPNAEDLVLRVWGGEYIVMSTTL